MSAAVAPKTDRTDAPEQPVPPDESLWQRYSAHNEAPLSGAGAFLLHALVAGPVLVLGALIAYGVLDWDQTRHEPEVKAVRLLKPGGSGLGGDKDGSGVGNGNKGEAGETQGGDGGDTASAGDGPKLELNQVKAAEAAMPADMAKDPIVGRAIKNGDARLAAYTQTDKEVMEKLRKGVRAGPPGTGTGNGMGDSGTGTGNKGGVGGTEGNGSGENLTDREKRQFRWAMHFPQRTNIVEYLAQLDGLGAILVVPVIDRNRRSYGVVSQLLVTPAHFDQDKGKDIANLKLLPFYEQNPRTAQQVAEYLKLQMPPRESYHVLYPQALEQRMARMELEAWQQMSRGDNNVDNIAQTVFEVFPSGKGWDVRVEKIVPAGRR